MIIYKGDWYRQVSNDEPIEKGDMHSLDSGLTLYPISSPLTIGDVPASFSEYRTFWRKVDLKR